MKGHHDARSPASDVDAVVGRASSDSDDENRCADLPRRPRVARAATTRAYESSDMDESDDDDGGGGSDGASSSASLSDGREGKGQRGGKKGKSEDAGKATKAHSSASSRGDAEADGKPASGGGVLRGFFGKRGGEAAALQRMEAFLGSRGGAVVRAFEKPQTSMVAWRTPDTTVLSPYLAAGVLSPRTFYARLREVEAAGNGRHTRPPVSLVGQLLWREHFHLLAGSVPHFGRMAGNPLCRQIPWDDPSTDAAAAARHAAWATARTGYPAVDACMAQLRKEGWVHHLGRHLLACFATRGDLWLSWEAGAATFEELLLDWDPALNAGNWMWLSASAFFNSYFRVYGPVTWMRKVDPEGKFIRHYLPALARLPTAYIYEPWKAPAGVQAAPAARRSLVDLARGPNGRGVPSQKWSPRTPSPVSTPRFEGRGGAHRRRSASISTCFAT